MIENYTPPLLPFLEVVYSDDDILVLNKQSGLLCVPGKGAHLSDCLERRAKEKFSSALTVHRLDMDTSGLMVMGLNKYSHRHLSLQFQNRNVDKTYIARVFGSVKEDEGLIDLPLICDWPNRPKQMVDHEKGKPSQTRWKVLQRSGNETLLLLTPLTGRSHQLRVHLLNIGHPILGDRFYAHDEALKMSDRLCLHSKSLTIMQPQQKVKLTFDCHIPF